MDVNYVYSAIIAVVVIILLYIFCVRRRRKQVAYTPVATQQRVEVQESMTTSRTVVTESFQSRQYSGVNKAPRKTLAGMRSNSLFSVFKDEDVHAIASSLTSLEEVSNAMRTAGLERCNLIFGVDYTASNYQQGKKTFGKKCLHQISDTIDNPYQRVIATLGETLQSFDSQGVIPAFGFGDALTRDISIFPLKRDSMCRDFKEVLKVYNQVTPKVQLSGPTNFAPLIYQAIEIVKNTNTYHILVIVADGQVTSERTTIEAIVEASNWPLSIIMVGVGDGPWSTMDEFDHKLPSRKFDNFHFVNFHEVTVEAANPNAAFALHALMEIPDQYKNIKELGYLKD